MASRNKPIEFNFTADVAKYLSEVKKMAVTTEDVEDAFVAVSNSSDDMERKLSRAMKDAESDVEILERAIKDLPDASGTAAREMDTDFHKVGDSASDAGKEAGQEFKQNLGESLSSGDLSSLVQDTFGGLVSSLSGPLAVGAAALAGVASLAFASVKKEAEELAAFTGSLGDSLRGLYEQGIQNASKLDKLNAFNDFLEEQADKIDDLGPSFDEAKVSADEYLVSIFEGGAGLEEQKAKLKAIMEQSNTLVVTNRGIQGVQSDQYLAAEKLLGYLDAQEDKHGEIAGQMDNQASASQLMAQQLGLADINADGIVDAMDQIDPGLPKTRADIEAVKATVDAMKNLVLPIHIKYTETGYTGGARQTSGGGQLTPVYESQSRAG